MSRHQKSRLGMFGSVMIVAGLSVNLGLTVFAITTSTGSSSLGEWLFGAGLVMIFVGMGILLYSAVSKK